MINRKMMAAACAALMMISMYGCGASSSSQTATSVVESQTSESSTADTANTTTDAGKITAIDGTKVTVALGTLSEEQKPQGQAPDQPGEAKDGSGASSENGSADSSTVLEKPSGDNGSAPEKPSGDNGNAPEKPSDDANQSDSSQTTGDSSEISDSQQPSGEGSGNGAPEKPSGDGQAPGNGGPGGTNFTESGETTTLDLSSATITKEGPNGEKTITIDDLSTDDILTWEMDGDTVTSVTVKNGGGMGQPGGMGQGSGEVEQGTAATTIDTDGTYSNETYTSEGDDENALRVDGATATLDGVTVNKTAGNTSSTENGDFYGMNAGLLATNGADVTIKNATVNTSAQNGNGIFAYGSGTKVSVSDSTVKTTADNSGGIMTTGGASLSASDLTVETDGNSAAAIRTDRGGGTVSVTGGSYTSNGTNSPAVYSTADISAEDATLTANGSEALVIEGNNSLKLTDCTVSGNMSDTDGASSDENVHNVMIYQSMSGDADDGMSTFTMDGGTLTGNNGDMFYVTNTSTTISLSKVTVDQQDADGAFLRVSGNSASKGWGTAGQNGGQVTMTLDDMALTGNIVVDKISTLDLTLSGNTTYEGSINIVDNAEGGTAVDNNAVVTVESGSTWKLTGNCTVTSVNNEGTIDYNGYTITLTDGTVLSE